MIRHEVILRMKMDVTREMIDRTLADVHKKLVGIGGVERILYGVNNAPAYRHVMLVIEMADEETLERFAHSPEYASAIRRIIRLAESSAVGSYLVGEPHSS